MLFSRIDVVRRKKCSLNDVFAIVCVCVCVCVRASRQAGEKQDSMETV